MANKRISELDASTGLSSGDLIVVVDADTGSTQKATISQTFDYVADAISVGSAAGDVLTADGAGSVFWSAPVPPSPAEPFDSIQFNDAGSFGGSSGLRWVADQIRVGGDDAGFLGNDAVFFAASALSPPQYAGNEVGLGYSSSVGGNPATYLKLGSTGDTGILQLQGSLGTSPGLSLRYTNNEYPVEKPLWIDADGGPINIGNNSSYYLTTKVVLGSSTTPVRISDAFEMPTADGLSGDVLTTDGYGNLSWSAAAAGAISGSGTATQIAYFTGSSAIGSEAASGSNSFTWDATNNWLGIGTATPSNALHVNGAIASDLIARVENTNASGAGVFLGVNDTGASTFVKTGGSTNTVPVWSGQLGSSWSTFGSYETVGAAFTAGGASAGRRMAWATFASSETTINLRAEIEAGGAFVINPTGDTITDFRVASDTKANMLFVDASANAVGIGTATPSHVVDVQAGSVASGVRAFNVDAALNSNASALGAVLTFTGNASATTNQRGTALFYGGTGPATAGSAAVQVWNYALGNSGTTPFADGGGVIGTWSKAIATSAGYNVGVQGEAAQGARNIAVAGLANAGAAATGNDGIGVYGSAYAAASILGIGGYFSLYGPVTDSIGTLTRTALLADNAAATAPIFLARDNGITTFTIDDGGYVTSKNTSDSTTAFQVQNQAGTTVLDVDTTNQRVGIGTATPSNALHVLGGIEVDRTLSVASTYGLDVTAPTSGSTGNRTASLFYLQSGYTGAAQTAAAEFDNQVSGTGTAPWASASGNFGATYLAFGSTTGTNVGALYTAQGGGINYGAVLRAVTPTANNQTMVGVAARGGVNPLTYTGGKAIGGYFGLVDQGLGVSNPTLSESVALLVDNENVAAPIFVARDNGTAKVTIKDGGDTDFVGNITKINNVATSFPASQGGAGTVLTNDGSGNLSWEQVPGMGLQAESDTAGTVTLDFSQNLPTFRTYTISTGVGSIALASAAGTLDGGRSISVKILNSSGGTTSLTFPVSWKFLGSAAPGSIANGKTAVLSIAAYGTADSDVVAAYAVEP